MARYLPAETIVHQVDYRLMPTLCGIPINYGPEFYALVERL